MREVELNDNNLGQTIRMKNHQQTSKTSRYLVESRSHSPLPQGMWSDFMSQNSVTTCISLGYPWLMVCFVKVEAPEGSSEGHPGPR